MNYRITSDNITELKEYEIFIFGSNLAGIHGAGAAKQAKKQWGAEIGIGNGLASKQTYALPTKDENLKVLSLEEIAKYIEEFYNIASQLHNHNFLVTQIGCGLAGYTPEQIAPLFKNAVEYPNISLPKDFWDILFQDFSIKQKYLECFLLNNFSKESLKIFKESGGVFYKTNDYAHYGELFNSINLHDYRFDNFDSIRVNRITGWESNDDGISVYELILKPFDVTICTYKYNHHYSDVIDDIIWSYKDAPATLFNILKQAQFVEFSKQSFEYENSPF